MAVQISGNDITVPRDGSFTRNVTIGGTLTYEDVTNIDSVGLVTARNGIEIGARPGVAASISVDGNMIVSGISTFGDDITFTGATSGRDVVFDTSLNQMRAQDNAKLCAGTSSDLEIYHNATNSYIDNYTGHIYVRNNLSTDNGGNIYLQAKSGEDGIIVNDDGAVELYHDNVKRFETDSNGARIVAPEGEQAILRLLGDEADDADDSFRLNAGGGTLKIQDASNQSSWEDNIVINAAGSVELYHNNSKKFETTSSGITITGAATVTGAATIGNGSGLNFGDTSARIIGESGSSGLLRFDTNGGERMRLDSAGRLQHGHTGSIVGGKIEVHAASPETQITINESSDSGTGPSFYINRTRGSNLSSPSPIESNNYIGSIHFGSYDTNSYEKGASIICVAHGQTWANGDCPARLTFLTTPDNSATPTEKMRILPDGRIFTNGLDGDTDITTTGTGDTYDGMQLGKPPFRVTRTSNVPAYLNRNGSGGNIIQFRYGGNNVGSISDNSNSLPSDRNYKKDITNLTLGLDLVNKLQPVSYHYKFHEDTSPVMYGLIAQDVETALNDAGVAQNKAAILQYEDKKDEKDSDYSLDYIKFTPILINAVKELSAEIESLKSEIAALKSS